MNLKRKKWHTEYCTNTKTVASWNAKGYGMLRHNRLGCSFLSKQKKVLRWKSEKGLVKVTVWNLDSQSSISHQSSCSCGHFLSMMPKASNLHIGMFFSLETKRSFDLKDNHLSSINITSIWFSDHVIIEQRCLGVCLYYVWYRKLPPQIRSTCTETIHVDNLHKRSSYQVRIPFYAQNSGRPPFSLSFENAIVC